MKTSTYSHRILLLLALGALGAGSAQADSYFLKFIDSKGVQIKGGSTDAHHKDFSEAGSWSLDLTVAAPVGGGKPQHGPFEWSQSVDSAFVPLFLSMVQGKGLQSAELDVARNSVAGNNQDYFKLVFEPAYLSELKTSATAGSSPLLNGGLSFSTLSLAYRQQDVRGTWSNWVTGSFNFMTGQSTPVFSGDPLVLEGLALAMPAAVPEPASTGLLLLGLASLGCWRQRRGAA
ncbi:type VI protein secretion system component Hcp [Paucibacter oligotrophus]|uniref:Type VI protein secretion system component Hcp n=1 Tax=Roseateles oligotrophus TaxID=1769250 RepID=A0A840LI46_9BURK|nr:type VI secretion system tube protein Hcp [Roseateles oligotrophus]MBB4845679.1 type VI protein secretion system component Hcp [Roseateles oligotrophus]